MAEGSETTSDLQTATRTGVRTAQRGLEAASGAAQKLADGFRRSDRFFKMRLAIVGAWAVLSVATLWGACGSFGPSSALGADVQMNGDSIMGVQVLVRNESDRIWKDVVLTLDDGWIYRQSTMRPRDLVVLPMTSFRRADASPPPGHVPRVLSISCGQGSHRFELR